MKFYEKNEAISQMINHPDIIDMKQRLRNDDDVILNALPEAARQCYLEGISYREIALDYCLCHGYHAGICYVLDIPFDD